MDVGEWLKSLGLEQYEAAFRENGVNAETLRHLTADDLKELGVAAVGHRRQLLVAIAKHRVTTRPCRWPHRPAISQRQYQQPMQFRTVVNAAS